MTILAFLILSLASAAVQRIAAATPALYAFGDSTTDVGNLLPGDNPNSIHPPYGIDYPGGTPTGRVSNGFLVVDYIAQAMGLPESPPAFSNITNETERGVNFAYGGSGILNTTRVNPNVITLDEQIEDFKKIAANLTAEMGDYLASIHLAQSLFYLNAGSNDLFALFIARRPVNDTQKDLIVALVSNKFSDQLKTLYKLGARKFAVLSTGRIGCIPGARLRSSSSPDCVDDLNDLSRRFKFAVETMLENLSATLEGFKYSFTDFYEFLTPIIANPSAYGFTEIKAACCGRGILNAEAECGDENTTYCNDRTQYIFWDLVHPTQALYKQLAQEALTGSPPLVTPVNVGHLILTSSSSPNCMRRSSTAIA